MADVLVLPAAAPLIHGVAERHTRIGIGEPERAAGAEVAERAGLGPSRRSAIVSWNPSPKRVGRCSTISSAVHLLLDRPRDDLRGEHVDAVQLSVTGERGVEPRHRARVAVAVVDGTSAARHAPRVDDPVPESSGGLR